MNVLIDTHILIWWLTDPDQLSRRAFNAVADDANEVFVSAASGYEIELKRPLDKLLQALPLDLENAVGREDLGWRPITVTHAIAAGRLPRHHRDPWDRLIVAQALQDGWPLVTADTRLEAYGAKILW
jgi:PIN domain nuclease of toxin-antitoxin system